MIIPSNVCSTDTSIVLSEPGRRQNHRDSCPTTVPIVSSSLSHEYRHDQNNSNNYNHHHHHNEEEEEEPHWTHYRNGDVDDDSDDVSAAHVRVNGSCGGDVPSQTNNRPTATTTTTTAMVVRRSSRRRHRLYCNNYNYYFQIVLTLTIFIAVTSVSVMVAAASSASTVASQPTPLLLRRATVATTTNTALQQQLSPMTSDDSTTTTTTTALQHSSTATTVRRQQQEQTVTVVVGDEEERTILVIRILDAVEDAAITLDRHDKLRSVLFDGDGTTTTATPSVQQQMKLCSGNAISFVPKLSLDGSTTNNDDKYSFIVDIVVDPDLITNIGNRNEWVEVMASIAFDPTRGPLRNTAPVSNNNGFILEPDDDYYYTSRLRQMAHHVIVLLPETSYPDVDFIATAEIDNSISIYAVSWATSLSAYMHELAHNLGLRHSGDTLHNTAQDGNNNIDTEYGDSSGYMGQSMITPWTPQKCYNAAQHWQLGWFNSNNNSNGASSQSYRLSLSDTEQEESPSLPLRINVAAFVEYMKLVSSSPNSNDEGPSFVILVQITTNIYLQFNRAKSYNIGTDPVYANEIVIIEQNTEDRSTRVLASLTVDEGYVILENSMADRIVHVCDIRMVDNVEDTTIVDFATIAISDSHDTNSISSVCQNGPDYTSVVVVGDGGGESTSIPMIDETLTPTQPSSSSSPPPTDNSIIATPSLVPVEVAAQPAPTDTPVSAPVVTEGDDDTTNNPPTVTPTIRMGEEEKEALPTLAPVVVIVPDTPTDDQGRNIPTVTPTMTSLRGSDPTTITNPTTTTTTTNTNESSSSSGDLSTPSIIYTVFGTIVGAVIISMVVLFFMTRRHSKPTTTNARQRRGSDPTKQQQLQRRSAAGSSSSSRSRHRQHDAAVAAASTGSSRIMNLSPDVSPIYRSSEHSKSNNVCDVEERSKNTTRSKSTIPSVTTKTSSQKPRLALPKPQSQHAVTTTGFRKQKNSKTQRNQAVVDNNHDGDNDSDSSDDDDDKSDTLSVILQQEIWKDRVQRILQTVLFVHDKDGTVTQMMPAKAAAITTTNASANTSKQDKAETK